MADYKKRMDEFIWYHINGDGDCNGQVLRQYALQHGLFQQACFDLAYFYSVTYCCASAVFLLEHRKEIITDCRRFADEYKGKLIFQSDRKYARMLDNFYKMLATWRDSLRNCATDFNSRFIVRGVLDTKMAVSECEKWYFFKRFSAYLFVETYCDILDLSGSHAYGLDYEGDSMTFAGGLFYVFGMDSEAEFVQAYHRLPIDTDTFEALIRELQQNVREAGGDDNFTKLETSLCAYEKFFKGTRYNGYYADRQLEELVKLKRNPEFTRTCESLFHARQAAIAKEYRGEDHDWNGIRTGLKKYYRETGTINES